MFCENCGRPIPDGQQSCQFCNPPAVQPAQEPQLQVPQFQRAPMNLTEPAPLQQGSYVPPSQQPIQQPLYQEPVQQSSYIPPVQQPVYQQPVQQYAQPAFELNMPAEGSRRKKKKSGGGKIFLAIVALLLVVGIVVAAINWKSITRFFGRNFGDPTEYLQDVEKEHVADTAKTLAASYDNMLGSYHPEGSSVDASVTLEVGSELMSLLNTALAQSGVALDLSWVESITLAPQVDMYENTMKADVGIGINNTHLATASVVWDMDSQTILVGVPELHDTYIEMDAAEVLGEEAAAMAQTMAASRELNNAMMEALPSGSQLEELLTKYLGIVIDGLSDAEKTTETVKAGGLEQDLLVLTVELSQKDILKIAEAVLEEAKDDETIEEILDAFGESMGQMGAMYGGEMPDLSDAFSEVVDEALDNLEYMIDEAESGRFLTIETFLDGQDAVAGRAVTVSMDGARVKAHYITVTEGGKFAFDAELATLSITGKGTVKDGKRTGSYTLTESGTDYVTLELEDYACTEDGQISGTFRLIPGSAVYEMMELDASVAGVLGQAALELTLDGDSVTVGIEAGGMDIIALDLTGETAKPSQIALPAGVSINDDAGGMQWISELNLDAVVANLEAAGVPAQYLDIVRQYVEMFRAEIG